MVPDKFNMVDMEGIDLILNQGDEIPGLYQKLVESIAQCRYQCLYNWKSDGVNIPPTYIELVVDPNSGNVLINTGIYVTSEDVIMIIENEPSTTAVEIGSFTLDTDTRASQYHISHNLGFTPDFVTVVADEFTASASDAVNYIANAYCAKSNLIASNKNSNGYAAYLSTWARRDAQRSVAEDVAYTKFLHDTNFEVPYYNSSEMLKAGVTYRYAVGKFN